jgi:hypothetical protein
MCSSGYGPVLGYSELGAESSGFRTGSAFFSNTSPTSSFSKRNLLHEVRGLVGYIASTVTLELQPDDGTSPETCMPINITPELMEAQ